MEIDFEAKMSGKTSEALLTLIDNRKKYLPEAISAAMKELGNRGHIFTDETLEAINDDIDRKRRTDVSDDVSHVYSSDMAIFPDNERPKYYSTKAILGFSIFVTTLFGAILLAINLKSNRKHATIVTIFGFIYTILSFYIITLMPESNSSLTYLLNGIGGIILTGIFWPLYIGKDVKYKPRPIWMPLIIATIITALAIWAILATVPAQ